MSISSPLPPGGQFCRALHDFHPPDSAAGASCLTFNAGQVLRCLNKDASGWWDGELEGRRGWFPSNYVEVLEGAMGEREEDEDPYVNDSVGLAVDSHPMAAVQRGSAGQRDPNVEGQLLSAIDLRVAELEKAVAGARASHYQAATSAIISAVRNVLSATDTLTRRAPALRQHPLLMDARKRILNGLATLVHQARVASAPTLPPGTDEAAAEAAKMLDQANAAVQHVIAFLDECYRSGVPVQARAAEPRESQSQASNGPANGGLAVTSASFGLRQARSVQDLRTNAKRPALKVTTSETQTATTTSPRKMQQQSLFSPDSEVAEDDLDEPFARARTVRSATELINLLSSLHDALLSAIAALIGHAHAHNRAAHSASYAQLIDLTRGAIERVRAVLLVVEAVAGSNPSIVPGNAERGLLAGCRERLYEATTALVTAARVATSPPRQGEEETEERASLLAAATAVLRSGGDAVGAVKLCVIQVGTKPFSLFLADLAAPPSPAPPSEATNTNGLASANGDSPRAIGARSGKRGANTLSMLGRKATSLSCLRDRYETEGQLVGVGEEDDEEEEEGDETLGADAADAMAGLDINSAQLDRKGSFASSIGTTSETVTSAPSISPRVQQAATPRAPSRADSASMAMMRNDSSRTSESAASSRSALSRASTNDTSPRSSVSTMPDGRKLSTEQQNGQPPAMPSFAPLFNGNRPPSVHQSSRLSASSLPPVSLTDDKWYLARDYQAREISFNGDGHVTGGTLRCLVERMTLHDTTIDPAFLGAFLLTFRLFASASKLFQSLVERFEMAVPQRSDRAPLSEAELKLWQDSKLTPVRLRIYNLFKTWIESYWINDADNEIVEQLLTFCRGSLAAAMPSAGQRLVEIVQKRVVASSPDPARPRAGQLSRMISTDRLRSGKAAATIDPYTHPLPGGPAPPNPVMGKTLLAQLKTGNLSSVTEIEPLELARQLTIKESRVYLAIRPEELLGHGRKGNVAVNVSQMSALSNKLTGWVSETILDEQDAKKRAGLVKYFIKLSQQCLALNNYNALMAIVCALTSSTISRLKKTWDALAPKYRAALEQLKRSTEHSRNYAEYRQKLRAAVPPALPFVGLFLTDLTFSYEGNPAERPSPVDGSLRLINFDRYQKMARVIAEQQRFQVPYNLLEVRELQDYLERQLEGLRHDKDVDSLWRQSLLVEPRTDGGSVTPSGGAHDIFNWRG